MLPSFYLSPDKPQVWSVTRAAIYGAGIGLVAALVLAITGLAPFWGAGPTWQLAFFYLLAFGGTALGCIAARSEEGPIGWLRGFLIAQIYTPYTWFLWPVLLRSGMRQLTERGDWAKTEREPLSSDDELAPGKPMTAAGVPISRA